MENTRPQGVKKSTIYLNSHVPQNPSLEYAESIEIPKRITRIISKGGGSTIDVGKWLARKFHVKHTAIPTTAGTGSEVTKYCVLTVDGKKQTFVDDAFIPDRYVLDGANVVSLPPLFTVATGLDALCQAYESLWSKQATTESKAYAEEAIRLVNEFLPKCLKSPNKVAYREQMLKAANLSGRAINIAPTNVCHAISYPLTTWYQIPHGIACSLTLKYFGARLGYDITLPWVCKYKIDKKKVAKETINHPKLNGFPLEITEKDICEALN